MKLLDRPRTSVIWDSRLHAGIFRIPGEDVMEGKLTACFLIEAGWLFQAAQAGLSLKLCARAMHIHDG